MAIQIILAWVQSQVLIGWIDGTVVSLLVQMSGDKGLHEGGAPALS